MWLCTWWKWWINDYCSKLTHLVSQLGLGTPGANELGAHNSTCAVCATTMYSVGHLDLSKTEHSQWVCSFSAKAWASFPAIYSCCTACKSLYTRPLRHCHRRQTVHVLLLFVIGHGHLFSLYYHARTHLNSYHLCCKHRNAIYDFCSAENIAYYV